MYKWKDSPHYQLEDSIVKMSVLPEMICRFNTISIKIPPIFFFTEIEKYILQFIRNLEGHQINKKIFQNKNKCEGFTLFNFKADYESIVIKAV